MAAQRRKGVRVATEGGQGSGGNAAGRFVRFCAGSVIKEASRDIGSDPLLPASRCSVSQEGQAPCRTVHLSGVQGGDGRRRVAVGRFVRLCAGQVIKEASRDIGSDPLLPASRCSVSQEGQTPCRTVHLSEVQGGTGGGRWQTLFLDSDGMPGCHFWQWPDIC